ncbi:UvrD-helicase domain-containing protein [Corynebacterium ulcerans]|uniref:UvrD-helicase domain-containing protein n=1 Tax=Corynebacterium ulcerans TaxID=65058 RepID=UPI0025736A9B|nr:UvrD-helicase domain-containing protein [Corynebacterium ulcerans]
MSRFKIFNAPAGSGKSTEIKARVREWSDQCPRDHMLCVTYTNRAADELKAGINADNVDVSTIHSFLAEFMKPMFVLPEIVDLYLDVYKKDIENRIANPKNQPHIEKSNAKYREKLGDPLTFELIAESIKNLHYNEMQFNSLFAGGLSHNDLLSFSAICAERFPGLRKRISSKYQQIIIDEYQDTSAGVLEFFVDAVSQSETSLHLYGDPMQQIYQLSSDRLRSILTRFEVDKRIITNYRSSSAIVKSLNQIYNDPSVEQESNNKINSSLPRIHLTNHPLEMVKDISDKETLVLSVRNMTIFDNIGAKELFKALDSMPDHGYSSRYRALDVLLEPRWFEVKNSLLQLMFGILYLKDSYEKFEYGEIIQTLSKYSSLFGFLPIENHSDKDRLSQELEDLFKFVGSDEVTIRQVMVYLVTAGHLKASIAGEYLENEDYYPILEVPYLQVRKMYLFNQHPNWSTQHGVKGESHDRVIFLVENSNANPSVHIDKLFNLWSVIPFSLHMLEEAYVKISAQFQQSSEKAADYFDNPRKESYDKNADVITAEARSTVEAFSHLPLFKFLYGEVFDTYFNKLNTSSASKLFKVSAIEGLLTAYRLFYVGCSRARQELDVVVNADKIVDRKAFSHKFEELGFEVIPHNDL